MQRYITVSGIICISLPFIVTQSFCNWTYEFPCLEGTPRILTPFIEEGNIDRGLKLAEVKFTLADTSDVSYSGFLTVNKTYNSNIFFWFFPAEIDSKNSPTVLRITGIPGASFLRYGFAPHIGPYKNLFGENFIKVDYSKGYNVLYMDNPVGTGFSFTESNLGYLKDEVQVGDQLYSAIQQFFQLFPEYRKTDFFIAGESLGSKHVPAVGYAIHTKNPTAELKINLQGFVIASPWIDPNFQLQHSEFLYKIGLIDNLEKYEMKIDEIQCLQLFKNKLYSKAVVHCERLIKLAYSRLKSDSIFPSLPNPNDDDTVFVKSYFAQTRVRTSLGVGNITLDYLGRYSEASHLFEILESVAPMLVVLIENYRVLLYNGQYDAVTPYSLVENLIHHLNWKGVTTYAQAERRSWWFSRDLSGFFKSAGNFTHVVVLNTGHFVSGHRPHTEANLIKRFIRNISFDTEYDEY